MATAEAIEIVVGQGAKPGTGGMLMGVKVLDEVAESRDLPPGIDQRSPARHPDWLGPDDLAIKIEQLREATDWAVPIHVKLGACRVADDVKLAAKAGADAIVIDSMVAGTGASAEILLDHSGIPSRYGLNPNHMATAEAIEIVVGQGAKPGTGGMLMGVKVLDEVAESRDLPPGIDQRSPARHPDWLGPDDLAIKIEQLREATDWAVPIHVKLGACRVADDVKLAAKAGADAIVIDSMVAGTGASAEILLDHSGIPSRYGLNPNHMATAEAIEIVVGQGAKPGTGGMLMGVKVLDEVAESRDLPPGIDQRSPARHPDWLGPDDLAIKIEQLREATDWAVPIHVKLGACRVADDVKLAAKAGADAIVIDSMVAGTGASAEILLDHSGIPSRYGLNPNHMATAEAIEIVVGQGAKPGTGGMLMGVKVLDEVAESRDLPPGIDQRSPARHPDWLGPDDLAIKIEQLREATDWAVPIHVKL
jgi:glutamate synthase domain-containing protein 2